MTKEDVTILVGDVRDRLKDIPDESVDCVVTSPPYWGLRDYGVDGQLGLEASLQEHIAVMVAVFAEIKRVLKPGGVVFVNYGDCYATTPNGRSAVDTKAVGNDDRTFRDKPFSTIQGVMKPKDLCMVPNRFAIAMQEDGWWVRSEIIWAKPNPMPESIKDRPVTSHEKIWMFTKARKYEFDAAAVRRAPADSSVKRWKQDIENQKGSTRAHAGGKTNGTMKAVGGPRAAAKRGSFKRDNSKRGAAQVGSTMGTHRPDRDDTCYLNNGRSLRNYEPARFEVWEMATRSFDEAHFATFPEELARRCIAAGCPPGGMVLDPFGGAGTTGLAAKNLGRQATLIELNPEYAALAAKRLREDLCKVAGVDQPIETVGPLFDHPAVEAAE